MLSLVLMLASMASAILPVVLDDYDGSVPIQTYGDNAWDPNDLLTNVISSGSQIKSNPVVDVDASALGYVEGIDEPVMSITLTANPGNTMPSLGKVMVADAADHRWMFYFAPDMIEPNSVVTAYSTSSNRQAEGTTDGVFDWSTVSDYWIQMFDYEGYIVNLTFDEMALVDITPASSAWGPTPERFEVVDLDTFSNELTWESPLDFVPVDPNLVSVQSYDLTYYVKDIDQVDQYDPNWLTYGTTVSNVTSPLDISGLGLTADQTMFWRVDTHVTLISGPSVVESTDWEFTTLTDQPVFITQPVDQTVKGNVGESAVFTVEVTKPATSFQWYKGDPATAVNNGDDGGDVSVISTATMSTLTIDNVAPADANSFYCTATNAFGSSASDTAELTVQYMMAYWPFDSDLQSVVPGSPAVSVNGSVTVVAGGMVGNCADFDGSGHWLQTTSEDSVYFDPMNSAMTVMLWVNSNEAGRWEPWVSRWGESDQGWQLRLNNTDNWPIFSTRGTNGSDDDPRNGDRSLDIQNSWHHIVGVTDGVTGVKEIYVDGQLYADGTGYTGIIPTDTMPPLGISCRVRGDTGAVEYNDYDMQMDEIKLFNYALTAEEIVNIYLADTGLPYLCPADADFPHGLDYDNNCLIDLIDFAAMASDWLDCARYPVSACP